MRGLFLLLTNTFIHCYPNIIDIVDETIERDIYGCTI